MNKCSSDQIRVLQIAGGLRDNVDGKAVVGGIASFLYNYYSRMDHNKIGFDFLAIRNQCFELYQDEFIKNGSGVFTLDIHSGGIKRFLSIIWRLSRFIKKHDYDAVHINMGAFFPVLACSIAAKKAGNKNVIVHSHSAGINSKMKRQIINMVSPLLTLFTDQYCACSLEAANNLFPRRIIKKNKHKIIKNAIDVKKYAFNKDIRTDVRKSMGYDCEFVIGHVGRFVEVKNHKYLIEVFSFIRKLLPDSKLLLVGDGELRNNIEAQIEKLGLQKHVKLLGYQREPHLYYQAMDLLFMPSIIEGFPIVVLEAQASGLPCYMSSNITQEVKITEKCKIFSLEDNPEKVAIDIAEDIERLEDRKDMSQAIIDAGYDLTSNLQAFESLYLKPNAN